MALKPYKKAVAVTGEYQDREGNTKKRYTQVGTLFQYDDGGLSLKIDAIPVGGTWNGFVSFFDLDSDSKPAKQSTGGYGSGAYGAGPYGGSGASSDIDDPIPF